MYILCIYLWGGAGLKVLQFCGGIPPASEPANDKGRSADCRIPVTARPGRGGPDRMHCTATCCLVLRAAWVCCHLPRAKN